MREVPEEEEFPQMEQRGDTELTLSPMALLGIFFGLALLCGLCFGAGYTMGSRGAQGAQQTSAWSAAQATGSLPKRSAVPQKTPGAQSVVNDPLILHAYSEKPGTSSQKPSPDVAAGGDSTQPLIKPVQPDAASTLMIQVAIVSHQEDADILIGALRKHGYTATARLDPADNKLHVRIGPFSNRNDAEAMRQKLLNDGYNAVVQP
jgi:cell division septation protein DedD